MAAHLGFSPRWHDSRLSLSHRVVKHGQLEDYFGVVAHKQAPSGSPRRSYGQGSLAEIEPGVWRMRFYLGRDAITGARIQPSRRFRGSRAAAERELARFRAELEESGPRPLAMSSRITLNEVVERHLAASD